MTDTEIKSAIDQLMQSERGRRALQSLDVWIGMHGQGLDQQNREAVLTLLVGAWGPRCGTVRTTIADSLSRAARI